MIKLKLKKKIYRKYSRGIAVLLTIIIISVASLIIAISTSRLGLGEMEIGFYEDKGSKALSLADGCGEEALNRLRKNSSYTGEILNIGTSSCIITVTGSGINRTIYSLSNTDTYTKKIEIQININNSIVTIISWKEVST